MYHGFIKIVLLNYISKAGTRNDRKYANTTNGETALAEGTEGPHYAPK